MTRKTPIASVHQQDLLNAYEGLLACSESILRSARQADWEAVIDLQSSYLAQVETLQRFDDETITLDQQARGRKAELLEQILERDREIRKCLTDRRHELAQMILGSKQQLALSRTYSFYQGTSEVIEAAQRFTPT